MLNNPAMFNDTFYKVPSQGQLVQWKLQGGTEKVYIYQVREQKKTRTAELGHQAIGIS